MNINHPSPYHHNNEPVLHSRPPKKPFFNSIFQKNPHKKSGKISKVATIFGLVALTGTAFVASHLVQNQTGFWGLANTTLVNLTPSINTLNLKAGDQTSLDLIMNTGGQTVTAIDLKVNNLNSSQSTVVDIQPNQELFTQIHKDFSNPSQARLVMTAICTTAQCSGVQGEVVLGKVTIKAINMVSNSQITFSDTKITTIGQTGNQVGSLETITLSPIQNPKKGPKK